MTAHREQIVATFVALMIETHGEKAIAFAEMRVLGAGKNVYVAGTWSLVVAELKKIKMQDE